MAAGSCLRRLMTNLSRRQSYCYIPTCHEATWDHICHHHSPCHSFLVVQLWPLRFLLLLKPEAKKHMHDLFWNVFRAGVCNIYFAIHFFCLYLQKGTTHVNGQCSKFQNNGNRHLSLPKFSASFWRANTEGTSYINILPVNESSPGLHGNTQAGTNTLMFQAQRHAVRAGWSLSFLLLHSWLHMHG